MEMKDAKRVEPSVKGFRPEAIGMALSVESIDGACIREATGREEGFVVMLARAAHEVDGVDAASAAPREEAIKRAVDGRSSIVANSRPGKAISRSRLSESEAVLDLQSVNLIVSRVVRASTRCCDSIPKFTMWQTVRSPFPSVFSFFHTRAD